MRYLESSYSNLAHKQEPRPAYIPFVETSIAPELGDDNQATHGAYIFSSFKESAVYLLFDNESQDKSSDTRVPPILED